MPASPALRRKFYLPLILFLSVVFIAEPVRAEKSIYVPTLYGTVRARYEYLTRQNLGAFKVRTLRIGVNGYVAPIMSYCAELDFSDWGKIGIINAYARVIPVSDLNLTLGVQRMPFTIAAHRQPCEQFFVNRSFLAKYGGIRDIGFSAGYKIPKIPLTAQAAVFNCSGIAEHKNYFTKDYGFSAKLISPFLPSWYASASFANMKKGDARISMVDVGAYFDNTLWHVEAEYLRKMYVHNAFAPVNSYDLFVVKRFPIDKKVVKDVSGALRYDYMSNHSSGSKGDEGKLIIDDPSRHRITAGATLSFNGKFQADLRLDYEKYFFRKGVVPGTDADDRIVFEIIAHF